MPAALISDRRLTAGDVRVYAYLDARAGRYGRWWGKQTEIVDAVGIAVRQVRHSVHKLTEYGYIWTARTGINRRTVLCYYIAARPANAALLDGERPANAAHSTAANPAPRERRIQPIADRQCTAAAKTQITDTDHNKITLSPGGGETEIDLPSSGGAGASPPAPPKGALASTPTPALNGSGNGSAPLEPVPTWVDFARALRSLHAGGVILMGDGAAYLAKAIQSGKDGVEPPISLEALQRCVDLTDLLRRAYDKTTSKLPTLNRIADFAVAAQQWAAYCREEPRALDPVWVRRLFKQIDFTEEDGRGGFTVLSPVEWVSLSPSVLVQCMREQAAKDAEKIEEEARRAATPPDPRLMGRVRGAGPKSLVEEAAGRRKPRND